jgi:hypothetical protein
MVPMTRSILASDAEARKPSMTVAIDTLLVDLGERLLSRMPWDSIHWEGGTDRGREAWRRERASDVEAIRGYVRAIRVLREASR